MWVILFMPKSVNNQMNIQIYSICDRYNGLRGVLIQYLPTTI